MKKLVIATAAAALVLGAYSANAQQKAPEKAPAAKTEKKAVKAKSACNAMTEEAACKADATCTWVAALMDAKTSKQKRKAYCKTKPRPPAKKTKEPVKK
jgi:hypothetical protein